MKAGRAVYKLSRQGEFVIENYNMARPWASFFPGIAGLFGIPLWVFYVNRGQCVSSFGVRSKDEAMMEFLPANKAYQLTSSQGFRTFIKTTKIGRAGYYEPFRVAAGSRPSSSTSALTVRPYELEIAEESAAAGVRVRVAYFSVPEAPYAALVRLVSVENIARGPLDLEILDGASIIVPYGVNNFFLKEMGRTIEAWMAVRNLETGVPLFKVMTDPRDTSEVVFVRGGHFYASFTEGGKQASSAVVVDPEAVFGAASDFSIPLRFAQKKKFSVSAAQATQNKTPCAFSHFRARLRRGEAFRFFSLLGHVFDDGDIEKLGIAGCGWEFAVKKRAENKALIEGIQDRIFTASGLQAFDLYARQTYLDNILRGGLPYSASCDGRAKCVYVFSRKHGDLERDYNRFFISASYFSEGDGNYRDVNQNRRSDVFFNPLIQEKNIADFMNLIQLDGYNPLLFKGDRFVVSSADCQKMLTPLFADKESRKMEHLLTRPFVLGDILRYADERGVLRGIGLREFAARLLAVADASVEAGFGEGYWSDHWTYNTDLLESFWGLYPEKTRALLLEKKDFTYYDTHVFVRPRAERYVLHHGKFRQYHALFADEEKSTLIQKRGQARHAVRARNGEGEAYKTTLLDKYVCLIANKIATLDPEGVGIEMEAEKPNWYDALNGLPGLLGSSISETFELKRLILVLKKLFAATGADPQQDVELTAEIVEFLSALRPLLERGVSGFGYWDAANALKEAYRFKVRRGVCGATERMPLSALIEFFDLALRKLEQGIARGFDATTGVVTTYFYHKVLRYETTQDQGGRSVLVPRAFEQARLPLFLEGFVHALRTEPGYAALLHRAVSTGPLFDRKLKMYKVNASLEKEGFEIGRAKAFTPGWLENESIWLHMEYKYVLELLKNGLYDEFYADFFRVLVPFQKPEVYGRSILENSSFIASSVHPDATLHGAGFVARLSGSTAEFLHMWLLMSVGPEPFFLDEAKKLCLRFRPALNVRLFSLKAQKKNYTELFGGTRMLPFPGLTYSFLFLGRTIVTYLNPKKRGTYGKSGVRPVAAKLFDSAGKTAEIEGGVLPAPHAGRVRDGEITRIEILLG